MSAQRPDERLARVREAVARAAADWLLRDGDLVEPWLFLIGADGNVADRWGVLFDPDEVAEELRQLPVMS